MELLGLRQRGACAVQVKLNPRAPLFERTFMAQQRALREAGGKIEALFGGKLFAGGDERGERGDGQVQQPPRNEGAQVFLDAVTGGLNGGAQPTQDGRAIHAPMEQQADHARRGVFADEADFALGRKRVGDDGTDGGRGLLRRVAGEDGLNERLRHRPKARLIRGGEQRGGVRLCQRGGGGQTGAGAARTGGVIAHAGADMRQARPHGRFVQTFAQVDDAVPRAGDFGIDDMRRGAIQNQQPRVRNGHAVEAVRVAGTEIERRWLAVCAERGMHPPHERRFAYARPALENQLAPQNRIVDQVVKAGDKAVRPHRAGEKGSGGIQKHPSDLADFPTPYARPKEKNSPPAKNGRRKRISRASCEPRRSASRSR